MRSPVIPEAKKERIMAELSEHDKRTLLGPNYRQIEEREARRSGGSQRLKNGLVIAIFLALTMAILIADIGVESIL